jgi:acetylornithine deacetylase/succinyl-diaminopimelate desuccinylase-like protein
MEEAKEARELLKKLVSFNTNTEEKKYLPLVKFLERWLKRNRMGFKKISPKTPDGTERPTLIVEKGKGEKTILIATHYDTVPTERAGWKTDPFELTEIDGKLYGSGATDCKGNIVAGLLALKTSNPKYRVKLFIAPDEEIGGEYGLKYLHEKKLLEGDGAIILDGNVEPTVGASGVILGEIVVRGKGGHAGMPFLTENPIEKAILLMEELRGYEFLREGTYSEFTDEKERPVYGRFSFTVLKAGRKENVIPEEAVVGFDLRTLPEENVDDVELEFMSFFEKIVEKIKVNAEMRIKSKNRGYVSRGNFVEYVKNVFGIKKNFVEWGSNDGIFFADRMQTVCFGVGRDENNIHAPNEFVYLKDIMYIKEKLRSIVEGENAFS